MRFRNLARGWSLAAAACLALTFAAAPAAHAQSTSYDAKDGNGTHRSFAAWLFGGFLHPMHVMEGMSGTTPTVVTMTKPGAFDVLSPDARPASSTITTADAGTSTAAGQSGVGLVTGAPTANSFQTQAINGQSSGAVAVTGTFVGTLAIEASYDGGTTYVPVSGLLRGTNIRTATITGQAVVSLDVTGATHVRVRATAFTSGTPNVQMAFSTAAGMTKILNGLQPVDSGGVDMSDPTLHAAKVSVVAGGSTPSPWTPSGQAAVTVTAGTSTSSTALTSPGPVTVVINDGPGTIGARVSIGSSTALLTDTRILPGQFATFATPGSSPNVDLISSLAGTSVRIESGTGTYQSGLAVDASKSSLVVPQDSGGGDITDPTLHALKNAPQASTTGGASSGTFEVAASDNHQTFKNGVGTLYTISAFSKHTAALYLRLYDAATGFNGCNSATGLIWEGQIPGTSGGLGTGFVFALGPVGRSFTNGLSGCVTGAFGNTDTTVATANVASVNIGFK